MIDCFIVNKTVVLSVLSDTFLVRKISSSTFCSGIPGLPSLLQIHLNVVYNSSKMKCVLRWPFRKVFVSLI